MSRRLQPEGILLIAARPKSFVQFRLSAISRQLSVRQGSLAVQAAMMIAISLAFLATRVQGEPPHEAADKADAKKAASIDQAELDAAFTKLLSGATLSGSFTSTGEGQDPTKLSSDKYTLGEVKKLEGNYWLIPARIQYGEKDFTVPLMLPVKWAGDTPVIVVDDVGLPGFGTVSARVMFFADHYAGYWKHGEHGGHLFGTIAREEKEEGETDRGGEK